MAKGKTTKRRKGKRGPKSLYSPARHPQLVRWMARAGLTNDEIAKELGITAKTLYVWQRKYPEIGEALKQGKEVVDHLVEDALLKRALGYTHRQIKVDGLSIRALKAVLGEDVKVNLTDLSSLSDDALTALMEFGADIEVKTINVEPDTTAQIFWLKNRRPDIWRDRIQNELTGANGAPLTVKLYDFNDDYPTAQPTD